MDKLLQIYTTEGSQAEFLSIAEMMGFSNDVTENRDLTRVSSFRSTVSHSKQI
jgi:hypothetical protein